MIQETTRSHYLGVLCSRCEAPIAAPRKAAAVYRELKDGETKEGQDSISRAFTLRCKVCNEEGVCVIEAIREFEGLPRARPEKGKVARA